MTKKITWLEAKAAGLKRYFTGLPCPKGHISERRVAGRGCLECHWIGRRERQAHYKILRRTDAKFKAKEAAAQSRWYTANRDRAIANRSAYYYANRDKVIESRKPYVAANKEMYRAIKRNSNAKRKAAPGTHTKEDIADILKMQNGRCAYCKIRLGDKYHVDHIRALARGGTNDRQNLQLLCRTCNCSKNAKDPIVFAQSRGMLL